MKTLYNPSYITIVTSLKKENTFLNINLGLFTYNEVLKNENLDIISSDSFFLIYNKTTKYYTFNEIETSTDKISNILYSGKKLSNKSIKILKEDAKVLSFSFYEKERTRMNNIRHHYEAIIEQEKRLNVLQLASFKIQSDLNIIKTSDLSFIYISDNLTIKGNKQSPQDIIVFKIVGGKGEIFPYYNLCLKEYLKALETDDIIKVINIIERLFKEGNYD